MQQLVLAQPVQAGVQIGEVVDLAAALELVRVDEVEPDLEADLVAVRDGVIFGGGEDVLFDHCSNHFSPVDRLAARGYSTSNLF